VRQHSTPTDHRVCVRACTCTCGQGCTANLLGNLANADENSKAIVAAGALKVHQW
jgi:hypothetical protein